MPYWDAVLKFEGQLDSEMRLVAALSGEYARWKMYAERQSIPRVGAQYTARDAKRFCSRVTSLAQGVFDRARSDSTPTW